MPKVVCRRAGCSKAVPTIALANEDPYCSSTCCRIDHGCAVGGKAGLARERVCSGCGGDMDEFSDSCRSCRARKASRISAGTYGR